MYRTSFLALLFILHFSVFISRAERVTLNDKWQFFYARDAHVGDSLAAAGFGGEQFRAIGFAPTPVPSNWAVLGYEEPVYRGFRGDAASEGFYLNRFTLPASYRAKRVELAFGGVWASAEVWLNGHRLGRHDSGYTSFAFDVTPYVRPAGENLLAVRVRQTYPGYQTDVYDDWTLGGIYRDVTLRAMPRERWIEQVRVATQFANDYKEASVTVKAMVADRTKASLPGNYLSPGKPYELALSLAEGSGRVVAERRITVPGHPRQGRETAVTFRITEPQTWTAETPSLYTLSVALTDGDSVTQRHTERIGLRELQWDGGVLRLNGRPIRLRGVNRHDEHPDVGRAVGRKHWLEDLRLMKRANINFIRACHYQHARGFVELCDSLGFYLGEEVSVGGAEEMMYDEGMTAAVMLRATETVERDVNSPSIIYWSVGNEDPLTAMHLRGVRAIHGLDASRPCLLPWHAYDAPDEIDILAPHYWTPQQYDTLLAHATRPMITTEFVHAYGENRFGGLADCWRAITRHPQGAGGAVWMWADQGLRTPTRKPWRQYNSICKADSTLRINAEGWDGIVDSYRRRTRDYYEVRSVYAPVFPTIDSVSVAEGDKTVSIPVRNDYDFLTLDALPLSWQLWVDGRLLDHSVAQLSAAPRSTADIAFPLRRLPRLREGETAYLRLTPMTADGDTIGTRTVEIVNRVPLCDGQRPSSLRCHVSPTTGLPTAVSVRGRTIIDSLRPTIWHRLTDNDAVIRRRRESDKQGLEMMTATVSGFSRRDSADCAIYTATVDYAAGGKTQLSARYVTTVTASAITVRYALTPSVAADQLPLAGLAATMAAGAETMEWFGLGPADAYPNKRTAPQLGLWSARDFEGTRAARWLRVKAGRQTLRLDVNGYIDRDRADDRTVRLVHHVLGRAEKGRLDNADYRLPSRRTYTGVLRITP